MFLRGNKLFFNHFLYGYFFTTSILISSSSIILPSSILTKNILPGSNLPCFKMLSGLISRTPVSEDIITYPSFVTEYLDGLKPFLSSRAPKNFPSVKGIEAGPSQGSIMHELYL